MIDAIGHALGMALAMGWEILWPLILGFLLSAVVQAVVSHRQMSRLGWFVEPSGGESSVTAGGNPPAIL